MAVEDGYDDAEDENEEAEDDEADQDNEGEDGAEEDAEEVDEAADGTLGAFASGGRMPSGGASFPRLADDLTLPLIRDFNPSVPTMGRIRVDAAGRYLYSRPLGLLFRQKGLLEATQHERQNSAQANMLKIAKGILKSSSKAPARAETSVRARSSTSLAGSKRRATEISREDVSVADDSSKNKDLFLRVIQHYDDGQNHVSRRLCTHRCCEKVQFCRIRPSNFCVWQAVYHLFHYFQPITKISTNNRSRHSIHLL